MSDKSFQNPRRLVLSNGSKRFILAIVLVLGFSLMIVLGPFIRCTYKHYCFDSYIRVLVELPSCEDAISGTTGRPCRYLFSFEGERNPGAIQWTGSELHHTYDTSTGTYWVTGVGLVTHNRDRIRIDHAHIVFDDQELPLGGAIAVRTLVRENGRLVSGFCEPRW